MTPQETQRTIDFIIRTQADAAIRLQQWDEKLDRLHSEVRQMTFGLS